MMSAQLLNLLRCSPTLSIEQTSLKYRPPPQVEFATPTFNVLNALEQMGYKVVTSGAFVTGHNKFDQVRGTHYIDVSNTFRTELTNNIIPKFPCAKILDWTYARRLVPLGFRTA